MKKTKSMIYTPSYQAEKLYICFVNDEDFYRVRISPVVKGLMKFIKNGNFDIEKATAAFYPLVHDYSLILAEQFPDDISERYNVTEKYTAAVDAVKHYFDDYILGYREV